MKNSFRIFKTDLKNIGTNWVAAILIGGLIILPSLYAWFNIKASWDPYGQTDQIPVGVVNEDAGAMVRDQEIHVGDDLVKTLKKNDDMDWQFVNRDKAMDKVKYGDYYAVIVIPKNFSEKLGTVISDNPEKAKVEYYVNEKLNAVAPKITEKGASAIVEQISSNFISTVNGVIFDMFNKIGIELESDLPDIKRFENYVFTMEKKLPEIHQLLNESMSDATSAQEIVKKAQGLVPDAKQVTNNGLQTIDETTAFLKKGEARLNEMAPKIKQDLEKIQKIAAEANNFISKVQGTDIDFSTGKEISDQLNGKVNEAIERINTVEEALRQLQAQNNEQGKNGGTDQEQNAGGNLEDPNNQQPNNQNEQIDKALEELETLKSGLQEAQGNANKINSFIEDKKAEVDSVISDLQDITATTAKNIDAFVKEYKENIEPTVLQEIDRAKNTLSQARGILVEIQSTIPEVERILNRTGDNLGEGKDTLEHVLGQFPYVNDKVNQLADRIRDIQGETDINEIIQLLQNDPEAERGFFAQPVELNENKLFPIPNYGTGMTPFYTVLAIWVGALLLISLLAVDIKNAEAYTIRQTYFGRLFTFMTIGLVQTLIVTLGDLFLIAVDVKAALWFVLFGLFVSIVFMLTVYTLVSVFGDVGKAVAIVFLVLQIAGSGGTYPVVLLPEFFQTINPFLPFTYAVDLMREAVGGIVWERAYHDILFLAIFGIAALLLGTFLKGPINSKTKLLMKKSKESGLFH
ncbi:phage infection protein [Lentibacillus populi]|uniref:Phage infection protein n=1 Tax=Lentibacillus populi TaxID=1827502 RepID=A0A9W5X6U7_9BACI|nr:MULTISPECIES: YhgE/Pip domain-containing protein [Bacillaceae]GGB55749.1 phage infection protein [Lentibacillus populi]